MKLPDADRALIDPLKLYGYLLSREHPLGREKARFFERLGYSRKHWPRLEGDLRKQHLSRDARLAESSTHGRKYRIRAMLMGPNGGAAPVVSIWLVPSDGSAPRFITAYPGEKG